MSGDPATLFLFAHGAGAGSAHPWMAAWAERLAALGAVERFDYPYMAAGRKSPDRLPKLLAAHAEALSAARAAHPAAERVVLIGKSMGSRVGCHLANQLTAEGDPPAGVVCLGYPLKAPSKTAAVRSEVLHALSVPILFVQGTRDRLCPLELLAEVRAELSAPNALHVVEEGDHSLQITKRHTKANGVTQEQSDAAALSAIEAWLTEL